MSVKAVEAEATPASAVTDVAAQQATPSPPSNETGNETSTVDTAAGTNRYQLQVGTNRIQARVGSGCGCSYCKTTNCAAEERTVGKSPLVSDLCLSLPMRTSESGGRSWSWS